MKKILKSPISVGFTTLTVIPNFQGIKGWADCYKLKKYFDIGKFALKVYHNGNMGNNIESVNKNIQTAFGSPNITIQKIKKKSISFYETGSPDYLYSFYALLNVTLLTELEN